MYIRIYGFIRVNVKFFMMILSTLKLGNISPIIVGYIWSSMAVIKENYF